MKGTQSIGSESVMNVTMGRKMGRNLYVCALWAYPPRHAICKGGLSRTYTADALHSTQINNIECRIETVRAR